MNITSRKWLLGSALLVVTLLVLGAVVWSSLAPVNIPLPKPNGYDDFVEAGQQVSGLVGDFHELDYDKLEDLISANAEALRLLRLGLSRQCRTPIEPGLTNIPGLMTELGGMKRLAQLFAAEGQLRELDNQPLEAARSYTDAIQFGNEMSRGGFLITRLVGIACEAIGYQALAKVLPNLSRDDDSIILARLEQIDAGRVTWTEIMKGEHECARYHFRNHLNPIPLIASWWNTRQAMQKAEARHKTAIAHERLLAAELALRCYRFDKTSQPACLDDLVPNYLSKAPQDPFSKGPMIYHPKTATNWLVYSVGPDGVDDGGKPAKRQAWPVKGDILVDSAW